MDEVIVTVCAVIAPPVGALCGVALTLTQLPGVTSVNCAGLTSTTRVCGEKSTVAEPVRVLSAIV
jgi:hypothetical protein